MKTRKSICPELPASPDRPAQPVWVGCCYGKLMVAAAAAVALTLHISNQSVYRLSFVQYLFTHIGPWIGTPTVALIVALSLYPRALSVTNQPKGYHNPQPFERIKFKSHSITVEEGNEQSAVRGGGMLRRLARKLGQGRDFLSGRGCAAGPTYEVPFFRQRSSGQGRGSSRTSSEGSASTSPRGPPLGRSRSSLKLESRWQPAMARISSGQDLRDMASGGDTCASVASHRTLRNTALSSKGTRQSEEDSFVYNGNLAVDCLPYDTTSEAMQEVKQIVLDQHLLQFGMLIGESSAELAIGQQHAAHPTALAGSTDVCDSLYGVVDCPAKHGEGWERLIEEHTPSLHYWVCRRHLRKGLYMYKSRTVYERATPQEMTAFTFANNETRRGWDDSSMALQHLAPPSSQPMDPEALHEAAYARSSFIYSRLRFPPPMAHRHYLFARRIWHKVDDGGCYCISRACPHPSPPAAGCRSICVEDFAAGFVIRAVPGIYHQKPAVEVVTNYFEDSRVNSGIVNMAIRKALWPMTQKSEAGFRKFVAAHALSGLPPRCVPPFEDTPTASVPPVADEPFGVAFCQDRALSSSGELSKTLSGLLAATPAQLRQDEDVSVILTLSPPLVRLSDDMVALEDRGVIEEEEPCHADTSLCNAGMFSGYHPPLTHRLYITPILYTAYLAAWRHVAAALRMAAVAASQLEASLCVLACSGYSNARLLLLLLVQSAAAECRLFRRRALPAVIWAASSVLLWLLERLPSCWQQRPGCLLAGGGMNRQRAGSPSKEGGERGSNYDEDGESLLSFPLIEVGASASKSGLVASPRSGLKHSLSRSDSTASGTGNGKRSLARRVLKVATVAARAAGGPLLHAWLSGKLSVGKPGQTSTGVTAPAQHYVALGVQGRQEADGRVRPPALPKHQRTRALMHQMFGWNPPLGDVPDQQGVEPRKRRVISRQPFI